MMEHNGIQSATILNYPKHATIIPIFDWQTIKAYLLLLLELKPIRFERLYFIKKHCSQVESFNFGNKKWDLGASYTLATGGLSMFSVVNFREYFVIMGGFKNQGGTKIPSNECSEYRDGKWRKMGQLSLARGGHSVIYHQHRYLVVGGKADA